MSQRTKVSVVVCLATFMAGLDLFIVNLAFPKIGRDFGDSSLATLSWVFTAFAIVYAALLVPAGRFADRTGRNGPSSSACRSSPSPRSPAPRRLRRAS
jgi:MFS family permease